MAPANGTGERAGIACGRGLPPMQGNSLLSHCFRRGGQGGLCRTRLGGWINGGLGAKVAFHVLAPILNDSSLERIRPLVGTREKVTRGRSWSQ